jgi:hypothetical protein
MRTMTLLAALILVAACSAPDAEAPPESPPPAAEASGPKMLGGCILTTPVGAVPTDLRARTALTPTADFGPFNKVLTAGGLMLVGDDAISDAFMELVATTIEEIFPADPSLDLEAQARVLRAQYEYRALIPFFAGQPDEEDRGAFDAIRNSNSVCDIIMEGVPGQVMEVVEHILHYVSDVGLHYAFPAEWGIHADSEIAQAMQRAVDAGYYDIGSYDDIDETDVRFRVAVQEFAYWVISTAWDLQTAYGPQNEAEWMLTAPAALRENMPELWAMYERTAARVMVAPSPEILQAIGPTRADEGE